jgi:hypothetical protein
MSELKTFVSSGADVSTHPVALLVQFAAAYTVASSALALLLVYVAGLMRYLPATWRKRSAPVFSFALIAFMGVLVRFGQTFLYIHADIDRISSGVTLTLAVLIPAFVRLFFVIVLKR